jgi:hypothetical protein
MKFEIIYHSKRYKSKLLQLKSITRLSRRMLTMRVILIRTYFRANRMGAYSASVP